MATAFICEETPRTLVCCVCISPFKQYGRGRSATTCPEHRGYKQAITVVCQKCSSEFSPKVGRTPRHCNTCRQQSKIQKAESREKRRQKADREKAQKAAAAASRKPIQKTQPRICYNCQEVFYRTGGNGPKGRDAGKCCSRSCGYEWLTFVKAAVRPVKHVIAKAKCQRCDGWFVQARKDHRFCSVKCWHPVRSKPVIQCVDCNTSFPQRNVMSQRCIECQAKVTKQRNKDNAKKSGAKAASRKARKMRLRGVIKIETVNPMVVLKRDRWTCQLCGVKTPQHLRGSYDDRAPEVDHINPLAQGGEHSYRNTQCACRKCNIAKSGTPKGQLRLFG